MATKRSRSFFVLKERQYDLAMGIQPQLDSLIEKALSQGLICQKDVKKFTSRLGIQRSTAFVQVVLKRIDEDDKFCDVFASLLRDAGLHNLASMITAKGKPRAHIHNRASSNSAAHSEKSGTPLPFVDSYPSFSSHDESESEDSYYGSVINIPHEASQMHSLKDAALVVHSSCIKPSERDEEVITVLVEQLKAKEKEVTRVQEEIKSTTQAHDKEVSELEMRLREKNEELRKTEEHLAASEEELQRTQQCLASKDQELQRAEEHIASKDQELQRAKEHIAAKDQEIDMLRMKITALELRAQQRETKAKTQQLQNEVRELKKKLRGNQAMYDKAVADLTMELNERQFEAHQKMMEISDLSRQRKKRQHEVNRKKRALRQRSHQSSESDAHDESESKDSDIPHEASHMHSLKDAALVTQATGEATITILEQGIQPEKRDEGPVPATQATEEAATTTKEIQEQLTPPNKRDQSVLTYTEPPVLKGYLRGVEIVNQTSLTYTGKAYSFHWEKHGLAINFPENDLPPGTRDCHITITASISGQYQFPNDCELVSGIYWIACPFKFAQPVTLEIQHCSSQTEPDEDQLSFVTAKCTQKDLPYCFRVLDGGVFPLATSYGRIQLTGFSGLAIIRRLIRRIHPRVVPKRYSGLLYYSPLNNVTASVKRWKAHFVISLNLIIHFTAIDKDYSGFAKRTDLHLEVQFGDTDETITLNLHTERIQVSEWTVIPAIFPLTITKEQVDSYKPGTTAQPASCILFMDWKSREEPISIFHKMELEGVQGQHNAFVLELPPGSSDIPNHPALPPVVPLEAAKAVGICDVLRTSGFRPNSWQDLAARLGISDPNSIAAQKPNDSLRIQETIRQWLEDDLEASWEKLAYEVSRIEGYGLKTKQNILSNAGVATTQ